MASTSKIGNKPPVGTARTINDQDALRGLIEQHDSALASNLESCARQEEIQEEYKALGNVLKTLPNKLSYDALIPIGPLVMAPGKLIHTNEIMCHMGGNWFVECSSKTALKLVANRIKKSNDMKLELEKEKQLILAWKTEAVRELNEGLDEGSVEIREEFDAEQHEQWKKEHREKVKKHHAELAKKKLEKKPSVEAMTENIEELELWERLDQLELEEELARYEDSKRKAKQVAANNALSPVKSNPGKKADKLKPEKSVPKLSSSNAEKSFPTSTSNTSNAKTTSILKSSESEPELLASLKEKLVDTLPMSAPAPRKRRVSFDQSKDTTHTFERERDTSSPDALPPAPPPSPAVPSLMMKDVIKPKVVERNSGLDTGNASGSTPVERISLFKQQRLAQARAAAARGSGDGPDELKDIVKHVVLERNSGLERMSLFNQERLAQPPIAVKGPGDGPDAVVESASSKPPERISLFRQRQMQMENQDN